MDLRVANDTKGLVAYDIVVALGIAQPHVGLSLFLPSILGLLLKESLAQVAEALVLSLAALVFIPSVVLRLPRIETKGRSRTISLYLGSASCSIFGVLAFYDATIWTPIHHALLPIKHFVDWPPAVSGTYPVGDWGFALFLLAFVSFYAYRGPKFAVFAFAFPSTAALMSALLVFDTQEMTDHVTGFLGKASYDGVSLVSNWAVLIVSASMVGWAWRHRKGTGVGPLTTGGGLPKCHFGPYSAARSASKRPTSSKKSLTPSTFLMENPRSVHSSSNLAVGASPLSRKSTLPPSFTALSASLRNLSATSKLGPASTLVSDIPSEDRYGGLNATRSKVRSAKGVAASARM